MNKPVGELLTAAATFEAACHVPCLPPTHRAARLHGHSFLADIRCAGLDPLTAAPGTEIDVLQAHIQAVTDPLDHQYLNQYIAQPTDENIARWIRQKIALTGTRTVSVQSTVDSGVDLDKDDHAHLWRRYRFQAAHQLPHVPVGHKCGRMHGHGFEVILHVQQTAAGKQLIVDYDELDQHWLPLQKRLNYACLNDIAGLENPTSESLSAWIWSQLKSTLPALSWVTVYETGSCGAHFDGQHYRIWKDLTLDSAVRLKRVAADDPRANIHGHTFTLRLHLHAPLDQVMGWTVDFGDVKAVFDPIFKEIDHQPLHEIVGDRDADTRSVAHYIRELAEPELPQLDRLDLYQTRGCGVILHWGELGPALPV